MTFIVFMLLFGGLCGWLDARLNWARPWEPRRQEVR
jgi:hypothetical protein